MMAWHRRQRDPDPPDPRIEWELGALRAQRPSESLSAPQTSMLEAMISRLTELCDAYSGWLSHLTETGPVETWVLTDARDAAGDALVALRVGPFAFSPTDGRWASVAVRVGRAATGCGPGREMAIVLRPGPVLVAPAERRRTV